jgi:hypothetical protein
MTSKESIAVIPAVRNLQPIIASAVVEDEITTGRLPKNGNIMGYSLTLTKLSPNPAVPHGHASILSGKIS